MINDNVFRNLRTVFFTNSQPKNRFVFAYIAGGGGGGLVKPTIIAYQNNIF